MSNNFSLSKLEQQLDLQKQIHEFRTSTLGDETIDKVMLALNHIGRAPLSLGSWKAMKILSLGHTIHKESSSPFFYKGNEIQRMTQHIESYPNLYNKTALDKYWNDFVACHENPKGKWGMRDIIAEVFGGVILHEGAITIGTIVLGSEKCLCIGHDKNYGQGRAKTDDHKAVIDILSEYNQDKYDKVVFFVDTPGADSGKNANDSHQAAMMSSVITHVSTLNKPTLTILAGEGGSGGAEVFFGTDLRVALPEAYYATIHPIGHSAILRGKYSPKEIVWMLGVDAPHLHKKGIIDHIVRLSLKKDVNSAGLLKQQLLEVLRSSFSLIESDLVGLSTIETENQRFFSRGLDLRMKTSNMLTPRSKDIKEIQTTLSHIPRYENDGVISSFNSTIKPQDSFKDIHGDILQFFLSEFDASSLTKFNILKAIDTLIAYVGSEEYTSEIKREHRNQIVGSLREQLYHFQAFFWTLSVLIEPKNYDRFFSTSGTHENRLISNGTNGLSYEMEQIESFLREIFNSTLPKHVHSGFDNWKNTHFIWMSELLQNKKDTVLELAKKFKQVHYDLPDTIVSLALLLEEKFIQSTLGGEYNSILSSDDTLPIDFHTKAVYEQIRFYEGLRKQIFGKCSFDEIRRKFLSSHTPLYPRFNRVATTALQENTKLKKPASAVSIGWGQIGYDSPSFQNETRNRGINQRFGVIMIDFSTEGGAIDGAAAANIIRLIEDAAREHKPIIMFLQSAGMYVDGGPEAVSSMTAINFAIAEYFRRTRGSPRCQIFSIPLGVCTGGTIASFAQAPGVITLPLSLSDIPFAGRIVTLDQLPLSSTLADFQVGKGNIKKVISNPFISESQSRAIYEELRKRGINVSTPKTDLVGELSQYLNLPIDHSMQGGKIHEYESVYKTNAELFHPYKRVAILNRGVIATKAARVLERQKIPFTIITTAADKNLSYVRKESKNKNVTHVQDYMMSELAIIQAIKDSGCDAVYLGYGFWSERDSFIALCESHNIVVIGPNSRNVKQMGDKIEARRTFKSVLSRIEPSSEEREKYSPAKGSDDFLGGDGIIPDKQTAQKVANSIGYPVMIKAVYGGGGKGIRRINSDSELERDFDSMSREALESFGNGSMYMEKALDNQRHIEVQIFADSQGRAMSLGVRDCTTQRNRQKIIEETGDLGINYEHLARLQDVAVAVTKEIGYVGAGTFEFLFDPETIHFTFMEMNTRIQVEHTITEQLIKQSFDKKINLIDLQFQVAKGGTHKIFESESISKLSQKLKETKKHVMEVRVCAEDPAKNFAGVSMAKIKDWTLNLPNHLKRKVRFETYLSHDTGVNHTSKYDSMIGQLIVSGDSREEARKNLIEALELLQIHGIPTNKEFALRILRSDNFRDRALRISSMDSRPSEYFDGLSPYTSQIESVSELREDTVVINEGEYVVRMNQDAKINTVPLDGIVFHTNDTSSLFEQNLNKVNSSITPVDILKEGFYTKDHTGGMVDLPEGEYQIIADRLKIDKKSYSRGKAILIIRPV
ncbi:ATP-grasp domain-containing protein [Candidatus Gracilibacteria bacterium]|nr:ATP-grasp domain-containing protein [Candidatus Gracilibacteria bacterium]